MANQAPISAGRPIGIATLHRETAKIHEPPGTLPWEPKHLLRSPRIVD
jgi:hypothetical protein